MKRILIVFLLVAFGMVAWFSNAQAAVRLPYSMFNLAKLNYVSGVTGDIQSQLNSFVPDSGTVSSGASGYVPCYSGATGYTLDDADSGVTLSGNDLFVEGDVTSLSNVAGATYGSTGVVSDAELLLLDGLTGTPYDSYSDIPSAAPDDEDDTTHFPTCAGAFNRFETLSGVSNAWTAETDNSNALSLVNVRRQEIDITMIDDATPVLMLSETGMVNNNVVRLFNSGATRFYMEYVDTVQQLVPSGSTIQVPQYGWCEWTYKTDRWVLTGLSTDVITIRAIETPTLIASELEDTSSEHDLVVNELKNTFIANASGTTAEYNMPACAEGWSVIFEVASSGGAIIIDPYGSEQYYLNGTLLVAGAAIEIESTVADISECIVCRSIETGTTRYVACDSKYSDWESQ